MSTRIAHPSTLRAGTLSQIGGSLGRHAKHGYCIAAGAAALAQAPAGGATAYAIGGIAILACAAASILKG